jgi:hypothetical protein
MIQNPWRIRRSCNYKSCYKLHLLYPQIFCKRFSPRSYFSQGEFSFRRLNSIGNYLGAAPPMRDCLFHPGPPVKSSWAHRVPRAVQRMTLSAVKMRRCLTASVRAATSVFTQKPCHRTIFQCWSSPAWSKVVVC